MYKIYFNNFNYYSANTPDTLKEAKEITRRTGFDSIIELDGQAVCTYSNAFGFVNMELEANSPQ